MQRHELDATALIAGILFLSLGLLFLADRITSLDVEARWIWPALLIGLGLALLAAGRSSATGAGREPPTS
jgi:Domain of unknown function (DUF5668)